MLLDANQLPSGARIDTDVAVVGAGPVGIALALELARAKLRVALIESGGGRWDAAAQSLGDTAADDPPHHPMSLTTRRQIGGTSNLWAGRCVPFDPIDFIARPIAGNVGWPLAYREVERYHARACEWLVCGPPAFDVTQIPSLAGRSLIPGWPGGEIRATALERWSLPTNFRRRYGADLRRSPLVTLVQRLTCTEIVCAEGGASVEHLACRTLSGKQVTVRARRYVLACGGLGGTRLLLASDRCHPGGIGNHSGHLGRWYMSHLECRIAEAHFATPPRATIHDFERDHDGVYVRRRFTFAPELLLEHDLPNAALWPVNPELGDGAHRSGTLSLLYLLMSSPLGPRMLPEGIRLVQLITTHPSPTKAHLATIARELLPTTRFALTFGYERFLRPGRKAPGVFVARPANIYPLFYQAEHLPNRASLVTRSGEHDALGMPRLCTRLRFSDSDIEGVVRVHEQLDRYLRRHRLGHLEYLHPGPEETAAAIRGRLVGGYAQAGTTRMSERPQDGVLDRDLAVHGFHDLFVASSSAFPTSSQANTTFMIVVLALRLADRLREALVR
ncbi:MAG TPA: FAD-dependent oxidoreductase [Solirubrobacteraceae bacterium]|jgi:choline dehydrogenase-like flavoprotein|nr:FAD-dependent oxidoreductase [Solirubrobacteraceae bacterium]